MVSISGQSTFGDFCVVTGSCCCWISGCAGTGCAGTIVRLLVEVGLVAVRGCDNVACIFLISSSSLLSLTS